MELRKKQEEDARRERMMQIMEKNPQLAMQYQMGQQGMHGVQGQLPMPVAPDQSGNPYASAGAGYSGGGGGDGGGSGGGRRN